MPDQTQKPPIEQEEKCLGRPGVGNRWFIAVKFGQFVWLRIASLAS